MRKPSVSSWFLLMVFLHYSFISVGNQVLNISLIWLIGSYSKRKDHYSKYPFF